MQPLGVITLIVSLMGQITCSVVFRDEVSELHEGDPCHFSDDNATIGQCQKLGECGKKHASRMSICGFAGNEPIVCCDVLQKQCENTAPSLNGFSRFSNHMVGETVPVVEGEFPFMALIVFDDPELRCGASLISKRFLLTAAHCIKNQTVVSVKLGTTEADDPGVEMYKIKNTFVHVKYQRMSKQNDIAIVELEKEVQLNSHVQPICLYTKLDQLPDSANLTTMGWGKNDDGDVSNSLLKGTIRTIPQEDCRTRFSVLPNRHFKLTENQLCALGDKNEKGEFTDSCGGDSGGPLVLQQDDRKFYLVGITSTGSGCGSNHFAGIYTKANKYLDWIIKIVVWDASS